VKNETEKKITTLMIKQEKMETYGKRWKRSSLSNNFDVFSHYFVLEKKETEGHMTNMLLQYGM